MKTQTSNQTINTFIKVVVLATLILASFSIAKPFILLIVWSIIVAVALYPFYQKVINLFKGKKKGLVTTLFIGVLIALIIVPSISMTSSIVGSTSEILKILKLEM